MFSMRWRLLSLILWLTLFFNIERLDFGSIDTINLPTPVYVVGLVAVLLAFSGFFRRRPVGVLIAVSTLLFAVVMVLVPGPELGGYHTYMTTTGLLMVLIGAALAHQAGQGYDEFQSAVEMISLVGAGKRLRAIDEIGEQIEVELDHSLRMQRPLSLVLLRIDTESLRMLIHRFIEEIQRSLVERYAMTTIANTLHRYLRKTNLVAAAGEPGRMMIIAPETTDEQVVVLASRVRRVVHDKFGIEPQVSTATLPNDALTFDDLHNVAATRLPQAAALPAEQPAPPAATPEAAKAPLPAPVSIQSEATGD